MFTRQKRLPELSGILRRFDNPAPRVATPKILLGKVRALAFALGGKLDG